MISASAARVEVMRIIILILISLFCLSAQASEKLFYITNDMAGSAFISQKKLALIKRHAHQINIIAPQIYAMNAHGDIWGNIDKQLLAYAHENHIKIMPLVINSDFNQTLMHDFLQDLAARERAIQEMIRLGKKYHFYGWQFDFENISSKDRDAFSHFFAQTAQALHKKHLTLSIAVVPQASEHLKSDYDRWIYENWSGGYDYKKLGKYADFITLMSYDNHTSLTTPGPIAPYHWVEKTLKLMLKTVPASKISLGLPAYSGYWSTGRLGAASLPEKYSYRSKESQLSYEHIVSLVKKLKALPKWNDDWQSSYAIATNDDKLSYFFIENAASFRAKLQLVSKYHLRGFSVWQLYMEDPGIWNLI